MKKLATMEESKFLRMFFGIFSVCFLIAAFILPDRATMFDGLMKISTNA